jgi:hypothetical protein
MGLCFYSWFHPQTLVLKFWKPPKTFSLIYNKRSYKHVAQGNCRKIHRASNSLVHSRQSTTTKLTKTIQINHPTIDLRTETSLGLYSHSCVDRIVGINKHLTL